MFYPFENGYGIYDVQKDAFVPLSSGTVTRYRGLARAFGSFGGGRLLGDLDGDNDLSVIDVTILQRCDVRLCDFPAGDEIASEELRELFGQRYYSDFNRDGERNIFDVTCIQRYLAGLAYSVG